MPTKTKAASALEKAVEDFVPEEAVEDACSVPEPNDAESEQPERLTGQELLDFYATKKAEGFSHTNIAYKAGYYTVTKKGRERTMAAQFNEAMLHAQGIETGGKPAGTGRSAGIPTKARAAGSGLLLVSQLVTRAVGAGPGSMFTISYPAEGLQGPGAQILLTLTDEVKPVVSRKRKGEDFEEPGTPLLDQEA